MLRVYVAVAPSTRPYLFAFYRFRYRETLPSGRRQKHRLSSRAPGHDQHEVTRLANDRNHRSVIIAIDELRKARPFGFPAVFDEPPRLTRALEQRALHVLFAPSRG